MNAMMTPEMVAHAEEMYDRHLARAREQEAAKPVAIVSEGPRAWFVVQSVVRGEGAVEDGLKELGCSVYLPKMRKDVFRKASRKWIEREFFLFNRYLFAELPVDPSAWAAIRTIDEIDSILGMGGKPAPIPASDVRRFMDAEAALAFDETRDARIRRGEIGRSRRETAIMRFPVGVRVRAVSGPFGGFSGLVTSVTGRGAVVAMLEIFANATPVEFPIEMVEPA